MKWRYENREAPKQTDDVDRSHRKNKPKSSRHSPAKGEQSNQARILDRPAHVRTGRAGMGRHRLEARNHAHQQSHHATRKRSRKTVATASGTRDVTRRTWRDALNRNAPSANCTHQAVWLNPRTRTQKGSPSAKHSGCQRSNWQKSATAAPTKPGTHLRFHDVEAPAKTQCGSPARWATATGA